MVDQTSGIGWPIQRSIRQPEVLAGASDGGGLGVGVLLAGLAHHRLAPVEPRYRR